MKQHISFAQLVGTTIKNYHLEQLEQEEQHVALFLVRYARAGAAGTCGRCGRPQGISGSESQPACTCPDSTGKIYRLRLFTLPEEITAQERLVLLGQVQEEVSRIAALQHPVIQPILEYGHEQGRMYLVTPFIPLRYALANILSTQGPLDVVQTGHNLELLASGLKYAHKRAINHGNLTASAVFLRPSSEGGKRLPYGSPTLQLTDIGIAHLQTLFKYGYGIGVGTGPALYQARQALGRPIRSMTDIAALGALLYQMLTAHDVFADGLQEPGKQPEIAPLCTWRSDLPAQLDTVINTALARDPTVGYQSLNALVDAYYQVAMPGVAPTHNSSQVIERRSVSHETLGARQSQGVSRSDAPAHVPTRQPLTRRKVTVAVAATGAGIVVAGGGWLFLRAQQGTSLASMGKQTAIAAATSPQQPTNNGTVIAHTTDLPVNQASTFTNPSSATPGILIHLSDNSFVAFDSTCTHEECQVSYSTTSKQIECPCHGAIFDPANKAAVVAGPASRPLAPIDIHINADGTITVG